MLTEEPDPCQSRGATDPENVHGGTQLRLPAPSTISRVAHRKAAECADVPPAIDDLHDLAMAVKQLCHALELARARPATRAATQRRSDAALSDNTWPDQIGARCDDNASRTHGQAADQTGTTFLLSQGWRLDSRKRQPHVDVPCTATVTERNDGLR